MKTWSFYDGDGNILADKYCGPDSLLSVNTPAGCWPIAGDLDPQRQRVQLVDDGMGGEAVPVVVSRLPPRPDRVVEGADWDWSDDAADWVLLPTLDGLRARRWAALREQRNALEVSPLRVDGLLFDVDERAVARIGLKALIDAKTGAITARSPELIAAFGDFYDSLNPEQQKQVRERLERRGHGWWGRG